MRIGSNAGRTARSSANMSGPLGVARRSMIPCITCQCSPANRALCTVSLVVAIGSRPKLAAEARAERQGRTADLTSRLDLFAVAKGA